MAQLFEVKDVDRRVYQEKLQDFIPDRLIDVHTHVWKAEHQKIGPDAFSRVVSWPARVANDNPVEDLVEGYRLLFPGKTVTPLMFASVYDAESMPRMNAYVSECAARMKFPALIYAHPAWTGADLEKKIKAGRFLGAKVYLNLSPSYIPEKEIRIFDFLPPHQLDVLNRNGWVVMLHIPRDGRLRDKVNLAQMLEIERNWPRVRVIIAHVGRAYCDEDMGDAFTTLAATKNMVFDFSANTNDHVFEAALRAFGPGQVPVRKRHAHHADADAPSLRGRPVRQRRAARAVRGRLRRQPHGGGRSSGVGGHHLLHVRRGDGRRGRPWSASASDGPMSRRSSSATRNASWAEGSGALT